MCRFTALNLNDPIAHHHSDQKDSNKDCCSLSSSTNVISVPFSIVALMGIGVTHMMGMIVTCNQLHHVYSVRNPHLRMSKRFRRRRPKRQGFSVFVIKTEDTKSAHLAEHVCHLSDSSDQLSVKSNKELGTSRL